MSWITVHGRTPSQRAEPVNLEAIKLVRWWWCGCGLMCSPSKQVKQSISVPVVANGDIRSESDVIRIKEATGIDGIFKNSFSH